MGWFNCSSSWEFRKLVPTSTVCWKWPPVTLSAATGLERQSPRGPGSDPLSEETLGWDPAGWGTAKGRIRVPSKGGGISRQQTDAVCVALPAPVASSSPSFQEKLETWTWTRGSPICND